MTTALLFALALGAASPVRADIAVIALSDEQRLADGTQIVPSDPLPDRVARVEFGPGVLRVTGMVDAPASVIGPPGSVAVTPDGRFALVTDARQLDPADPTRIVPADTVSLIALGSSLRVEATGHAGAGASGVAIDRSGQRALVASRSAGTVSLFAIDGSALRLVGSVSTGGSSSPAQPVFIGGDRALVTRDGDHRVSVLHVTDSELSLSPNTVAAGLRPYGISSTGGRYAVTATMAGAGRDIDMITLIDVAGATPRAIDSVAVGLTPEGIAMSPDGRFVAVTVNNGSNMPAASAGYHRYGLLQIWEIVGGRLVKRAEAHMGGWGQGVAWSRNGRELLAEAMVEQRLETWRFDGRTLRSDRRLVLGEGPSGLAVQP